jgi:DNA replication protein DnaC
VQIAEETTVEDAVESALLAQVNHNHDLKIQRLLKQARLSDSNADVSQLSYQYWPKLNKRDIERHFNCEWVLNHRNMVGVGPTGSGKTNLACALAKLAIYRGLPVRFFAYSDFTLELLEESNKGSDAFLRYRKKLSRYALIIIDDWDIYEISDTQRKLLFDFIVNRDKNASLFITSQKPVSQWHKAFGDPLMADAIIDRINNHSYILDMATERSLRELSGVNRRGANED